MPELVLGSHRQVPKQEGAQGKEPFSSLCAQRDVWARLCPAPWAGAGSASRGIHLLGWDCWVLGALDPAAELEGPSPAFQDHFGLNPITLLPSRAGCGWQGYHGWSGGLMFPSVCT